MKIRLLPFVAALFVATSIMTSCLDSEEQQVLYDPESSITGFSVGTLHIDRVGKDSNGEDSAYVDTVSYADYPFTIDQINRTIENRDSFPIGTHINKVVTNVSYDTGTGMLAYRPNGSERDTVWTSTDSIDFTSPVQFRVYMHNGSLGKPYTVKINVHRTEPDTMTWNKFDLPFDGGISGLDFQKTVYADGKIYVFGEDAAGNSTVQRTTISNSTPGAWENVSLGMPLDIKPYSAMKWRGSICFLGKTDSENDYTLYYMDPETGAATSAGRNGFYQLIAADESGERLYASTTDGLGFFGADLSWTKDEGQSIEIEGRISSYSEALPYNAEITRTVIMGYNASESDTAAVVYQRLSSENEWIRISQNQPMPNLKNISMIRYDGQLYAFGGPNHSASSTIKTAFKSFYGSTDLGLTWWETKECMFFPEEFASCYTEGEGSCSATVDSDNFIWIVWENGSISRGRINRLGFAPKW